MTPVRAGFALLLFICSIWACLSDVTLEMLKGSVVHQGAHLHACLLSFGLILVV